MVQNEAKDDIFIRICHRSLKWTGRITQPICSALAAPHADRRRGVPEETWKQTRLNRTEAKQSERLVPGSVWKGIDSGVREKLYHKKPEQPECSPAQVACIRLMVKFSSGDRSMTAWTAWNGLDWASRAFEVAWKFALIERSILWVMVRRGIEKWLGEAG